ncbi:MAG TPA: hypothetical protein VNA32_07355 [Actinomycetota bacterium]|nr:hypothetical protein [Actinomycetota bacterium]
MPEEPKWNYCGEFGCTVVRIHWHCVSCGEPCAVGDNECDGCWAEGEDEEAQYWVSP